jgi:Integrase core domain/Chromo (CHRromatin Organisation MOdifier) domain
MEHIRSLYYNPIEPSSYGGIDRLYRKVHRLDPKVKRSDVKKWLSEELAYTLHKPVRYHFQRNRVVAFSKNEQWQADLADMRNISRNNNGYKYILTVIDVFSKYAYARPLKSKKPEDVIEAFQDIFKLDQPLSLQTDRGLEFVNRKFNAFLKQHNVRFFTSKNQTIKCSIVERWNRTLKNKIYRYFTAKGTKNWVKSLQDFVTSYNNSVHRSIKMSPASVTDDLREKVFRNLYGVSQYDDMKTTKRKKVVTLGEKVRLSKLNHPFKKGYLPNWSEETYEVTSAFNKPQQPMYQVRDELGGKKEPRLYPAEIQVVKVTPNSTYRVEKILSRKVIDGLLQYKIKWVGLPASFNSWIPATDVLNLNDHNS